MGEYSSAVERLTIEKKYFGRYCRSYHAKIVVLREKDWFVCCEKTESQSFCAKRDENVRFLFFLNTIECVMRKFFLKILEICQKR